MGELFAFIVGVVLVGVVGSLALGYGAYWLWLQVTREQQRQKEEEKLREKW
jgi:hypothetical protein